MADRARLAAITQTLRDARDDIERINEPHDPGLGEIQLRLAVLVQDLRNLPYHPPVAIREDVA